MRLAAPRRRRGEPGRARGVSPPRHALPRCGSAGGAARAGRRPEARSRRTRASRPPEPGRRSSAAGRAAPRATLTARPAARRRPRQGGARVRSQRAAGAGAWPPRCGSSERTWMSLEGKATRNHDRENALAACRLPRRGVLGRAQRTELRAPLPSSSLPGDARDQTVNQSVCESVGAPAGNGRAGLR